MDAITVKVPALLVMVEALSNAGMDYVTLSTQAQSDGYTGYLCFEGYKQSDPSLSFVFPAANMIPPAGYDMHAAQIVTGLIQ